MKTTSAIICFFIFLSASPCFATVEDSQIWTSVTASTPIAPKFDATLELHARFTEDSDVLGQRLARPSITYKLNDRLSFTGGYFYGLFNPPARSSFHEQRLWQQSGYVFYNDGAGIVFSGRTRLEERFVEDEADTGYRLRQQFRFQLPVADSEIVRALLWNETFFGLNETSWGQRKDIDQTRNFAGLSLQLTDNVTFEPGYLNQVVFGGEENRMNHIGFLALAVKF